MALASMNILDMEGCDWLVESYGKKWEHIGTTALVITSLIQQGKLFGLKDSHHAFIWKKAQWLNLKLKEGFDHKQLSTYNLAFQALILADIQDIKIPATQWLLKVRNDNGSWGRNDGEIMATANSLITLALMDVYEL